MKLNNKNIIKNVSYNQRELIYNILSLHNNGQDIDLDITYSSGGFYKKIKDDDFPINEPKFKMDVSPQSDDIIKIEPWGKIPIEDNTIKCIMIDLPFVISPRKAPSVISNIKGSNIIMKRFASYYPKEEMFASYHHWIIEAYRVLQNNGICIFKTQNTVSGGINISTEEMSWLFAKDAGFHIIDKFTLLAKSRIISGKIKTQAHARKYTSTFYVFQKNDKRKLDYYSWQSMDENKIKNNACN